MGKWVITAESGVGKHIIDLIRNPEKICTVIYSLFFQKIHSFFNLFCRRFLMQVYSKDGNDIKNAFNLVFNSGDFHYELNLNKDARNLLVQSALDMLRDKAEIIDIFASYPGGEQSAFAEMQYSLPYILKGVQSTDLYATFVANVSGIFHNHSMIQTLAWLQSYDSWFEASAK